MPHIKNKRFLAAITLGFLAVPTVAFAATDAVPGDPFKLGQDNKIQQASTTITANDTLSSGVLRVVRGEKGIGAALRVDNDGTGIARGIDINVQPGKPPIAVSNDAGKASNLNVDELDGRDETDFLPSRIYSNGTPQLVTNSTGSKTFLLHALNAGLSCDGDDIAISAGAQSTDPEDHIVGITPFAGSYQILFRDNGSPSKFKANIICADNARPFR
ncbi:hypothetical protein OJ998_07545 [Solirubrobacter taibaiensis]|nr:hypothetical protein [Solirubrobacter taibaiensis]